MSALQWAWQAAHHCVGAASVDIKSTISFTSSLDLGPRFHLVREISDRFWPSPLTFIKQTEDITRTFTVKRASVRVALRDVQCSRCNGHGKPALSRYLVIHRFEKVPASTGLFYFFFFFFFFFFSSFVSSRRMPK
jgi:hypothetical protein